MGTEERKASCAQISMPPPQNLWVDFDAGGGFGVRNQGKIWQTTGPGIRREKKTGCVQYLSNGIPASPVRLRRRIALTPRGAMRRRRRMGRTPSVEPELSSATVCTPTDSAEEPNQFCVFHRPTLRPLRAVGLLRRGSRPGGSNGRHLAWKRFLGIPANHRQTALEARRASR